MCSSFSRSPCIILDTGMPVARDTTSAISSAPTRVRSSRGRLSSPSAFSAASAAPTSAAFRRASRSGSLPYCSSASLSNWPLRCSSAISARTLSISSLMAWVPCTAAFSAFQISSKSLYSRCSFSSSSSMTPRRRLEASSVSFLTASRSIFNWMMRRSSLSITSGLESISMRMRAPASSIRSMALSGRKRSVM
ncbi:hypothetical protein D3C72_1065200 [compost metagenome]